MKISTLIVILFSIAFLPRLLTSMGLPKILNFTHFFGVVLLFFITKPWDVKKLRLLNTTLAFLIITIIMSSVLNGTGIINIILEILLFCEPLMLLILLISGQWNKNSVSFFKYSLTSLCFFHIALSLFQFFILGQFGDNLKGVFLGMGAGHHVGGAITLAFGIYWFFHNKHLSLINRSILFLFSIFVVLAADAKQVLAVNLVAFCFLSFFSSFQFVRFGKNVLFLSIAVLVTFFIGKTIYPSLLTWVTSSTLISAIGQKLSVFQIVINHYDNFLCWFLGLGPGHTTSRLAMLMNEYGSWLYPLGATTSPLTETIFWANQSNWMSNSVTGSSVFSLMFSWAGIWGDIGLIGVGAYICCWLIVLQKYTINTLDRYWIFCIFVYGITFSWLEEPGFMLFIVCLLGLSWQENQCKRMNKTQHIILTPITRSKNAYPSSP